MRELYAIDTSDISISQHKDLVLVVLPTNSPLQEQIQAMGTYVLTTGEQLLLRPTFDVLYHIKCQHGVLLTFQSNDVSVREIMDEVMG